MRTCKTISIVLYSLVAIITLSMALKFFMATEYFVYHSEASGMKWEAINPGLQTVYLALFKICGAGFFTTSIALIIMIVVPFAKYHHRWSYYAIPMCGWVFWSITLATTVYVTVSTPATAPWIGSLINVVLLVIGFVFSTFDRHT